MGHRLSCIPHDHGGYSLSVDNNCLARTDELIAAPANPQRDSIPAYAC